MREKDFLLSVVIPVFNEELLIPESVKRLCAVMQKLSCRYELIFVDDGSHDHTWEILQAERRRNPNIRLIRFSRNFGHQMAITAGMDDAKGDVIVTIDADLQDPPELMEPMLAKWQEGYEVVYARRIRRLGETIFKKWTAAFFYRLVRRVSNVDIPVDVGDYRLMSRKVVEAMKGLRERHRYIRGLMAWLGFKQAFVDYVREKRFAGTPKYSFMKMIKFSMDGLASFSILPLRLATVIGFASALFAFFYILYALYVNLVLHDVVRGWTTVTIAIFFLGGIQLICLGIIGEYIGMIHEESKQRPLYVIDSIE